MKGYVSNIQKFSVNDGYGIRTIVFLLGCNLKCQWCQNPETLKLKPQLMYVNDLCKVCGRCETICPKGGPLKFDNGVPSLDSYGCNNCFECVEICPYDALKASGREMTVEEVVLEVMKDEVFYRQTGGGLTMSGGEPLLQIDFTLEILKTVHEKSIGTCIETAGNVPWFDFEKILPFIDLILYDIKFFDSTLHLTWTGTDNDLILSNFAKLARSGKEVIARVPLIPTVNDALEFRNIVDFIAGFPAIRELHILPFHNLGSSKYEHLGMCYNMSDWIEDNDTAVKECQKYAEQAGFRVSVGGAGF